MTLKDDLLADESIVFDEDDTAENISFTTLNKTVFNNQLAIFDENNTVLIMNEGLETNKSDSIIKIARSLYDQILKVQSNLSGCMVLRKKDSKEWEVKTVISTNQLMAYLACQRNIFNKAKG